MRLYLVIITSQVDQVAGIVEIGEVAGFIEGVPLF